MANMISSSSVTILDEEIDRVIFLCTQIDQMASNIRFVHLANISYSPENIQSRCHSLLSMAENIEGSAILLESLLNIQQRNLIFNETKKSKRIHYTRDKLLQLQQNVTLQLSNQFQILLNEVVERECNDSVEIERQSWRDIKTILMY